MMRVHVVDGGAHAGSHDAGTESESELTFRIIAAEATDNSDEARK